MKDRVDYESALSVVRQVIHGWDPYALLAGGAPHDEFDEEIARVVAQIPQVKTRDDATHTISRVFSATFEPENFTPEQCADVGQKLFDALIAKGLLTQPK